MPRRNRNREVETPLGDFLYRAEIGDPDFYVNSPVYFIKFRIIRRTPQGVWIQSIAPENARYLERRGLDVPEKWVSTQPGRKRFAYRTKRLALESLKVRKIRHVLHLEQALQGAQRRAEFMRRMPNEEIERLIGENND